ncbi:MAG TPA: septal ring lytic transglycosylase RlpA family protein [Solirubrobacteraceae bacterium]|nr:septal ring lytic transglycosylase RlpA family protein [Solirubrobacteraceae bacterium]
MPRIVIRRAIPYVAAFACAAGFVAPSLAEASGGSGGSGFGTASGGSGSASGSQGQVTAQPGNVPVTASGDGMTISTNASGILRRGLTVTGSLPSADSGKTVDVEISGAKTNWAWETVATGQVRSNGTFSAVWATNHIGRFSIRAVTGPAGDASASAAGPTVTVTVYRPSLATLYGPGFYGHKTACGVTLRRTTIGVANRTLPCGTPVAIYYDGETLIVPVIDRGPYAHNADWDLTMATGKALGMTGTALLDATSLPRSS